MKFINISIVLSALMISASAPTTIWVHGLAEQENIKLRASKSQKSYKLRIDYEQKVANLTKLGIENKKLKGEIAELESVNATAEKKIKKLEADVSRLTQVDSDDAALPGKTPDQ